jgi:predicted molibdopterin-dependent oxidoreductase YjgC
VWGFKLPTFQGLSASEMVAAAYRGEIDVFWMVGGNFLETLPDPAAAGQALENVSTRIHQDVVLSSMMLLPPKDTVIVFPATTRYESPGGGTETSTERRIIFSPEIPGRRIGSAKPEWEVFGEVAVRVRPELKDKIRLSSSQRIRDEMGKAIPLYAGIERLSREGDNFQWGGRTLFADGKFATPDGKAIFSAVTPKERRALEGMFYLSTRRGKQFNSMVHRAIDPLTGHPGMTFSFHERMPIAWASRIGNRFALLQVSGPTSVGPGLTRLSRAISKSIGPKAVACSRVRR